MVSWNIFKKRVDRSEGLQECKPAPILDDDWKYEELTPGKRDVVKPRSHTHSHPKANSEQLRSKVHERRSTRSKTNHEHSNTRAKVLSDPSKRRVTKKHKEDISQWLQESFVQSVPECLYDTRVSSRKQKGSSKLKAKSKVISAKITPRIPSSRQYSEVDQLVYSARNQMASLLYTARNRAMLTETMERPVRMRPTAVSNLQASWMNDPVMADVARQADRRLASTYQARRLESEIQIDREIFLQDYIRENRLSSSLYTFRDSKNRYSVHAMPVNCSSPIRCCTRFHSTFSSQEVQIYRDAQRMLLSRSFLGQYLPSIYATMDSVMALRRAKSIKLAAWKKRRNGNGEGYLSVKDWLELDRPLVDRLQQLNEHLKKTSVPLRIVFRKTQETEQDFEYDFWFVFPNTLDEIRGGYKYWEGVEHVTTLDDYYNTNRGRY